MNKVQPVAGTIINPQFRNALAYWPDITGIPQRQSTDSNVDARPCSWIAQAIKPACVRFCLADFDHCLVYLIRYTSSTFTRKHFELALNWCQAFGGKSSGSGIRGRSKIWVLELI